MGEGLGARIAQVWGQRLGGKAPWSSDDRGPANPGLLGGREGPGPSLLSLEEGRRVRHPQTI